MAYCERATSTSLGGAGSSSSFSCSDLNTCTNVVFPGSVKINNLTVTGSQYIEHEVDLYVGDPLFALNTGIAGANSYDIGWVGYRGSSINVASIWDETADQFALITTTDDGSTHGNLSITSYADLKLRSLDATGPVYMSGNVGIGTSDPLNGEPTYFGLDISGSSATAYQTRIHLRGSGGATASSTDSALVFYHGNENAGATVNFKGVDGSDRGDLYFSTDNGVSHVERMVITSGGNVGIGTTTPTNLLSVSGAAYLERAYVTGAGGNWMQLSGAGGGGGATSSNLDNGYTINQNLRTTDDAILDSLDLQNTSISLTSSGNVGIGTAAPAALLHVVNDAGGGDVKFETSSDHDLGLVLEAGSSNNQFTLIVRDEADRLEIISDSVNPIMTFLDNGNVGIGTNNPTTALTVAGTISGTIISGSTIAATTVEATSLHQFPVLDVTPTNNYVLAWDNGDSRWEPKDIGTIGAATASNLDNGYTINQNLRTTDDVTFDSGIFNGGLAVGLTVPSGTVGSIVATNDIISFSSSDERLKDNITPIPDSLTKISQIAGVEFDWNEKAYNHLQGHDVGVIAHEVESVLPEAVTTRDDGYKAVRYEKIVPLLIEAIKEQEARISALEKKLD